MIDTCASEFKSYIPYFYSTYEHENESVCSKRKKVVVLGSGPIRIGQGVEFDYSTTHAIWTIQKEGYEAIVINNNPETVSTDYTLSDKLYFEPLTIEDVMNVIDFEKPEGVIVSLGGQTPINLTSDLAKLGVKIIGSQPEAIDAAEDRDLFERAMAKINIPLPKGTAVTSVKAGVAAANEIGYPVLVRPSFVLGGRMMRIIYDEKTLKEFMKEVMAFDSQHPVLIDKYIMGIEAEVDAVCDGKDVFIPGIMQLVERTGVHSGDSMSVYPPYTLSEEVQKTIVEDTVKIGLALNMVGLFNIQFIVQPNGDVSIIEVNPRSSRTVPFLAKSTGAPIADIAAQVMLGHSLKELGYVGLYPKKKRWYVKTPIFSFSKIQGMDIVLSPEMKSTGEAIGYDHDFNKALYKSLRASGQKLINYGTVFTTIADKDKEAALPLIRRFYNLGFNVEATKGTAEYLKEQGIKTRIRKKISEGSEEILDSLRKGYVSYVINTMTDDADDTAKDGVKIRRCAIDNSVPVFTCLDTVEAVIQVLEQTTMSVSTIDAEE